ncbi:hypothetical protein ACWEPR_23315 [Streptomyces sp. NPDC004290]
MKMRKSILRAFAIAVGGGGLAWLAVAGGMLGTAPGAPDSGPVGFETVADEAPGYAVEDLSYPDADKILTERGIVLKRGDGNITLAECGSANDLLVVGSRSTESDVCFKVTGAKGFLALEIPDVHVVKGNSYSTKVNMTVGTEEKSFDIKKNTWTGVGESADPEHRDFLLVEIRTVK